MRELETAYVTLIFDMVGIKPSDKQKAELLRLWQASSAYNKFKNFFIKAPDSKEMLIREQLENLPRGMYKSLRDWTKQFSRGIGGPEPGFSDKARRAIIQEVRTLQKNHKRKAAIQLVAGNWHTTPTKIEGLLKHQNRYKDA
jgi:hypothetical protein